LTRSSISTLNTFLH